MISSQKKRIDWIDTVKGFGIILMVYGHNYPFLEGYIYTFHMPLFFFIAGLFHPSEMNIKTIKRRTQQLIAPYFLWSMLLFVFWVFIGRNYGNSSTMDLSILKNLIGIFYAQGDNAYMNWGIPMWFLLAIFLSFLIFGFIRKLQNIVFQVVILLLLIILGFIIPKVINFHLIWSLDVALVSLFFYALAFYFKDFVLNKRIQYQNLLLIVFLLLHLGISIYTNNKVDMYRSTYGNEFLFLVSAIIGVGFWVLFFKKIKRISVLSFFGKNTIPVLALQIRAVTFIKLLLMLFLSYKTFNFNEIEKVILVMVQLIILYPVIIFINKYIPILNGKTRGKARN